jgi:putative transport protein
MDTIIQLLADNPLLLLFVVVALGYPLGRIKIRGFSLGLAAVLFVGIAVSSFDARLSLPSTVYYLGLVIFVYTIGLASGPSFVASFRRQGWRDNGLVFALLALLAGLAALAHVVFDLNATLVVGLFAGSLTNTPALASVLESLQGASQAVQAEPVVAYAVTYPTGVIGVIVMIQLFQRWFRADYPKEAKALRDLGASGENLVNKTIRITRTDIAERSVRQWQELETWQVILGRYKHEGQVELVQPETILQVGDEVSLIGSDEALEKLIPRLGELVPGHLELDRSQLDFRRIFVSNPEVADKTLKELDLPKRFGALITRVRRGDSELLPRGEMRLELGDRVRVVAQRERMSEVAKFFGDSYKALSEVDMMSLGVGIALGLLLGLITIPLPGGLHFSLGFAGGPLLVGLILGTLGRTGPVVWQIPYSANLTLRQLGLVIFLAGVGTRSGFAFVDTLLHGSGLQLFLLGGVLTLSATSLTLLLGHYLFKIPMSLLIGIVSGLHTQPAVLAFASEQTENDLPSIGYATVFPVATIAKILLAQLLLALLS